MRKVFSLTLIKGGLKMENINLCLTILITGFTVVFAVLLLLILVIKIYGTIVSKTLKWAQGKREAKQQALLEEKRLQNAEKAKKTESVPAVQTNGINPEIVAVIAAAVCAGGGKAARITSIKKSKTSNSRPAWGMAGILENTKPF